MSQPLLPQQTQPLNPCHPTTPTLIIAKSLLTFILTQFQSQLQTTHLKQYLPLFNTHQLHQLNSECVSYFYLEGESKSIIKKMDEDPMPKTILNDNITTFHIRVGDSEANGKKVVGEMSKRLGQFGKEDTIEERGNLEFTLKPSGSIEGNNNSLNYSMSKSHHQASSTFTPSQDSHLPAPPITALEFPSHPSSSLHLTTPHLTSSDLLPLPIKPQPIDRNLQTQLESIKKHLYTMRRYRKIGLEEERERLDGLARKKNQQVFFGKGGQHTYGYDGMVLGVKGDKGNSGEKGLVQEIKPTVDMNGNAQRERNSLSKANHSIRHDSKRRSMASTSLDHTQAPSFLSSHPSPNLPQQPSQPPNPQRNISSKQQHKSKSFTNGNKRQVSHLPFILLKDNTRIIENKRELSGSVTLRNSLNRSKVSLSDMSTDRFRSYAQIEQEKRLQRSREQQQKCLQFGTSTHSNEFTMTVDILPPTLNLNPNSQPLRKQSRMMQKYLKKLTEQRSRIEMIENSMTQKSVNFQQLKVPQKYAIQRYYEYDYEEERQGYQFGVRAKLETKRSSVVNQVE